MNAIVENLTEQRNGHYVHALELSSAYELESVIETLCSEFIEQYTKEEIVDFFCSMSIYYYTDEEPNEDDEIQLYNCNVKSLVEDILCTV